MRRNAVSGFTTQFTFFTSTQSTNNDAEAAVRTAVKTLFEHVTESLLVLCVDVFLNYCNVILQLLKYNVFEIRHGTHNEHVLSNCCNIICLRHGIDNI